MRKMVSGVHRFRFSFLYSNYVPIDRILIFNSLCWFPYFTIYEISYLLYTRYEISYISQMQDPRPLLLSFGNELAAVSDKKSLIRLISDQMRSHLTVSDILLSVINEDRQTHSVFVHHQDPSLESGEEYALLGMERF